MNCLDRSILFVYISTVCLLNAHALAISTMSQIFSPMNSLTIIERYKHCDSCKNRCNTSIFYFEEARRTYSLCSCDSICVTYKDCCLYDIIEHCPHIYAESLYHDRYTTKDLSSIKVNPLLYEDSILTVYGHLRIFIDKCKDAQCKNIVTNKTILGNVKIPIDGLPVVDTESGLYYLNEECALCNDIHKENIYAMKTSLPCRDDRFFYNHFFYL